MTEDVFEKRLRELTRVLRGQDKTASWKGEILARARREARSARLAPPRTLLIAWAAAWAAILVFTIAAPGTPTSAVTKAAVKSNFQSKQLTGNSSDEPQTYALLWQRYNFSKDLP